MAHIGAGAVAECQRGPVTLPAGVRRPQQSAHLALTHRYAQSRQAGRSSTEAMTLPTKPYSMDSSTLIQ